MPSNTATDRLSDLIAAELPDLVAIRHDLHAHPELGYAEQRTSGVVQRELEQAGVAFKAGLAGGTGVLGHLDGAANTAIGLRADMDALPIEEETGVSYASTTAGTMHACGHDGHTTILIGAARVLAKCAANGGLPRPVAFVFQPAEEGGAGGKRMVEDGCLDGSVIGPPVASMFGLHGWPRYPLAVVGTRPGPLLAAADQFEITVTGRGGHAAFPHLGHDPVVAGSAIVTAVQTLCSRETDPLDSVVVSVTQFHGGTAHNIIPDQVRLAGTVRTLVQETQERTIARLHTLAESIARAHGCTASVEYSVGYPVTLNDAGAVETFNEVAHAAFGKTRVQDVPQPFMGGEDFSFYCHKVPSCFFVLGLLPPEQDTMPDLHQPTFDFNDDAIATGVEAFCRLALRD
ncbi:MAG: amidohydrolase [Phycisphaerales bacterium]|nr:amidohydrolase [Phycisphaerae bacterium]NNF43275.1 amidohydrolase [Phycisphaerales bacterium]NNM26654.1 amidohydrolase [Phycisphaerales bacterium]